LKKWNKLLRLDWIYHNSNYIHCVKGWVDLKAGFGQSGDEGLP
jgi:hypothetical protein